MRKKVLEYAFIREQERDETGAAPVVGERNQYRVELTSDGWEVHLDGADASKLIYAMLGTKQRGIWMVRIVYSVG